jgi:hypothetical protein
VERKGEWERGIEREKRGGEEGREGERNRERERRKREREKKERGRGGPPGRSQMKMTF